MCLGCCWPRHLPALRYETGVWARLIAVHLCVNGAERSGRRSIMLKKTDCPWAMLYICPHLEWSGRTVGAFATTNSKHETRNSFSRIHRKSNYIWERWLYCINWRFIEPCLMHEQPLSFSFVYGDTAAAARTKNDKVLWRQQGMRKAPLVLRFGRY